jgi:hypothetical protein
MTMADHHIYELHGYRKATMPVAEKVLLVPHLGQATTGTLQFLALTAA